MRIKKIQIFILIILSIFMLLSTTVMANSITYQSDGLVDTIVTESVVLSYQSDGLIEKISVNSSAISATITIQSDGLLDTIVVPSGKIIFQSDGLLDTVNGNWNNIFEDVQKALEIANSEIVNYITSINIQVPGASNPSASATVITESLNDIIDELNSYGTYITSNNSTLNNGSVTVNPNGININSSNNGNASVNPNGININSSNNGNASVSANGVELNLPSGGSVSVGENGLDVNMFNGSGVTIDKDGIDINTSVNTSNNTMVLFIIIGVVCYVIFLIIVFIIKMVQGEKVNMKLIKVIIAVGTLIFFIFIVGVLFSNIFK